MPTYKTTWEFAESNGSGFNEVYYTDEATAHDAGQIGPGTLASRLALLHPLNTFLRIRANNVGGARDTFTLPVNQPGTSPGSAGPLPVGASVVCQLSAPGAGTRKLWMRGCPANFYTRDATTGRDSPGALLTRLLRTFFSNLQLGRWGIRKLTNIFVDPTSPYSKHAITSVDGSITANQSKITLDRPIALVGGDRVVIGGTSKKDTPALNGHFTVIQVQDTQHFFIAYTTPNAAIILTTGGYARKETYSSTAVFDSAACSFDHFGTRTSRSPLSNSRGARRAARIRLSR